MKASSLKANETKIMQTATIQELEEITAPYALQVVGYRLTPELWHGQYVAVEPASVSKPGDLVVAAIEEKYVGMMWQNADGDLWDKFGGYILAGRWRPIGIVNRELQFRVE